MKKFTILLAFLCVCILKNSTAQTITSQKGLTTILFNTSYGKIKVYLPEDIRQGDILSGSVVVQAEGATANKQSRALNELLKSKLKIGNPSDANAVSQALLKLYPAETGKITRVPVSFPFLITLTDNTGKTFSAEMKPSPETMQVKNNGCSLPSYALAGSPLKITGSFDGDLGTTTCMLNDKPMELLAESPRQCFVTYPENATGRSVINITENNKEQCRKQVQSVQMDIKAGRLNLLRGEKTTVHVQITGLSTLKDSAKLSVTNQSKEVVQIAGGNEQVILLTPQVLKDSNVYTNTFTVTSIKNGGFSLTFSLDLPEEPPIVFADNNGANVGGIDLHPLPVKGLKNGMADAFEKAYIEFSGNTANKYPELDGCGSCIGCIRSMLKEDIVALVGDIGKILIDHYVDILVSGAGGALAWIKDKYDKLEKAEDIASAIGDAVTKGEIEIVEFKERLCGYCLVSAIGFYDAKTQCMDAFFYCKGSKMCCTHALTIIHLKYCVNDDGFKKPDAGLSIDIISK